MGTMWLSSNSLKETNQTEENILNTQEINTDLSTISINVSKPMITNRIDTDNSLLNQIQQNPEATYINSSNQSIDSNLVEKQIQDNITTPKTNVDNNNTENDENSANKKESLYIQYGNELIKILKLKSFGDNLIGYDGAKYSEVSDKFLTSTIVKKYKKALPVLCSNTIFYIKASLYDENAVLQVDTNHINFLNGLLDLRNNHFKPHTPEIITINQVKINYIFNFTAYNKIVNDYLDAISNNNPNRKKALLQIIGYCMTSRNDIQKFIFFYGPTASNGKSTLVDIMTTIIGKENVSHKSIKTLEQRFGANGIQNKLLNIVADHSAERVKDISNLKSSISGDTFESDVKFRDKIDITTYVKHIFALNNLPTIGDKTEGFYRKINILLFDNKFDPKTSTFDIQKFKTQENLDYLGNLAIREYLAMVGSGILEFANQEESDKLLKAYKDENDTVASFLLSDKAKEHIYGNWIRRGFVFNLYKDYCSLCGLKPIGLQAFYRELREKYGFIEKEKNNHSEIDFYREYPIQNKTEEINDDNQVN